MGGNKESLNNQANNADRVSSETLVRTPFSKPFEMQHLQTRVSCVLIVHGVIRVLQLRKVVRLPQPVYRPKL